MKQQQGDRSPGSFFFYLVSHSSIDAHQIWVTIMQGASNNRALSLVNATLTHQTTIDLNSTACFPLRDGNQENTLLLTN
jgi:hypothetical protein